MEAITRTLEIMWGSGDVLIYATLGTIYNIVMLLFDDEDDLKCIFDKYNGLFHLGEVATVEDTRFDTTSFWV